MREAGGFGVVVGDEAEAEALVEEGVDGDGGEDAGK